jgi:type VI secretion system secreted protein Hcp
MAQVDYFLKLDDIDGESEDAKYPSHIQLESWGWGASQGGTFASGGGGGAGKVSMQDFHFVMKTNKASAKLFLACASGEHIGKGVLRCRKAGKDQQDFMVVTFTDLLVSSYQTSGSGSSDVLPMDQISLNFAKIQIDYKYQDNKGKVHSAGELGWDQKKSKAA